MNTVTDEKENRRLQRFSLALPTRVESHINRNQTWFEITRLTDVSIYGAAFNLNREIEPGRLLQMTIPMPRQMRCYDFAEAQYKVWGLVRSCIVKGNPRKTGSHSIGVAFIGKRPPSSYYDDPTKLFELSHLTTGKLWNLVDASDGLVDKPESRELRRHTRFAIPTSVVIETIDADGNVTASESTVTENISLSGTAVFSTLDAAIGEFVRIRSDQYDVSIISIVRGRRVGKDNIPRLHVEFVDRFFPLEGIE